MLANISSSHFHTNLARTLILEQAHKAERRSMDAAATLHFLLFQIKSSRGVTAGVSIGGASGSLSLSIDRLDESVNENTEIGESLMEFTIGSREEPSPIYTKVVMMNETLVDGLWAANEMSTIRLKKMNLETALRNYTIHKGAQIAAGMFTLLALLSLYTNT